MPASYEFSLNSNGWRYVFQVFVARIRTVLEDANMKLSDAAVRNAKANGKVQKLSDGGGLYLHVSTTGSKLWRMAYRLKAMPPENASPEISKSQTEPIAVEEAEVGRFVFRIPSAVWKGKPDHAVRDAMKDTYPLAVIAYVLFHWCGSGKPESGHKVQVGRKTQLGRLFTEKEYSDPKSYGNLMNSLLQKADACTIVKG